MAKGSDSSTPAEIEAARRLLEANGWRCVPPEIKERVVWWTLDGQCHGATLQPLGTNEETPIH